MDLTVEIHIIGTIPNLTSEEVMEMSELATSDPMSFVQGLNSPVVDVDVSAA